MDVRFHRLAIREYEETRAWYERRREGLGDAFTNEVDRAVARIAKPTDRRQSRLLQRSGPGSSDGF
jgi:hypothetical protein